MALFAKESEAESIILMDIGPNMVVGAYAHFAKGIVPSLVYEKSVPVESHDGELVEAAVARAIKAVGDALVWEGAPVLVRATGSGAATGLLVSIDAPWQSTSVRIEHVEDTKPFVFTKRMASSILEKTRVKPAGKMLVDESITGTILNGYETNNPYGKEAHRASIVVLTSLIDEAFVDAANSILRSVFHTRRILPIASSSLRYQAMRSVFPHEQDALVIDVTESATTVSLIRKDLLVAIAQIPGDFTVADGWTAKLVAELVELAREYPLPRSIFLLAREAAMPQLQQALATAKLGQLWLSDTPPTIIPVAPSYLSKLVQQSSTESPDLFILLMALFWQHHDPAIEL